MRVLFEVTLALLLILATGCDQPSCTSGPSLIAFTAIWCDPCQRDKPLLAEVGTEFSVVQIDVDKYPAVASQYRVKTLPTYIVLDAGARELQRTGNLRLAIMTLHSSRRPATFTAERPSH